MRHQANTQSRRYREGYSKPAHQRNKNTILPRPSEHHQTVWGVPRPESHLLDNGTGHVRATV